MVSLKLVRVKESWSIQWIRLNWRNYLTKVFHKLLYAFWQKYFTSCSVRSSSLMSSLLQLLWRQSHSYQVRSVQLGSRIILSWLVILIQLLLMAIMAYRNMVVVEAMWTIFHLLLRISTVSQYHLCISTSHFLLVREVCRKKLLLKHPIKWDLMHKGALILKYFLLIFEFLKKIKNEHLNFKHLL